MTQTYRDPTRLLNGLVFAKSADEIRGAIAKKVSFLKVKIAERQGRIVALREEHSIDDATLSDLLMQNGSRAVDNSGAAWGRPYSLKDGRVLPAGLVQNLLTERGLIDEEQTHIDRLSLIDRNLLARVERYENGHEFVQTVYEMTLNDLEYLGF